MRTDCPRPRQTHLHPREQRSLEQTPESRRKNWHRPARRNVGGGSSGAWGARGEGSASDSGEEPEGITRRCGKCKRGVQGSGLPVCQGSVHGALNSRSLLRRCSPISLMLFDPCIRLVVRKKPACLAPCSQTRRRKIQVIGPLRNPILGNAHRSEEMFVSPGLENLALIQKWREVHLAGKPIDEGHSKVQFTTWLGGSHFLEQVRLHVG